MIEVKICGIVQQLILHYCAITDNVRAQRSYLTVARFTDAEWRSALKVH